MRSDTEAGQCQDRNGGNPKTILHVGLHFAGRDGPRYNVANMATSRHPDEAQQLL
jgi:hypothetical protein